MTHKTKIDIDTKGSTVRMWFYPDGHSLAGLWYLNAVGMLCTKGAKGFPNIMDFTSQYEIVIWNLKSVARVEKLIFFSPSTTSRIATGDSLELDDNPGRPSLSYNCCITTLSFKVTSTYVTINMAVNIFRLEILKVSVFDSWGCSQNHWQPCYKWNSHAIKLCNS